MKSQNKVWYSLCYVLVVIVFVTFLFLGFKSLNGKEENIINQEEVLKYHVHFILNGADSVSKKSLSCELTKDGCHVILPFATRDNGVVLGFGLNSDDTTPKYRMGDVISLSGDMDLYVISYKTNYLHIASDDVDYIEQSDFSCSIYNTETSCTFKMPSFNKIGYENRGYSTSKNSLSGFVFPNENYKITKDVTLYPIYGTSNHLRKLDIKKTVAFNNSFIEIENGCADSISSTYINYLNEIKQNTPFLLIGSKITFVNDNSFNEIWGRNYVGMNYGPRNMRSLDVRCSTSVLNDYYGTMVHELSHSWDFYYATKVGDNITSQSDIINLYNKYSKLSNRPFRDYSYSNQFELLADMMKYYYFKYLVPRNGYKDLNYPNDIKEVLEKYICISKNNYNDEKCK